MSQPDRKRQTRDRQHDSHLQHAAEHTRPRKPVSVISYLAILFGVAFLLLLMSYFMQQRQNAEATGDALRQSASAVETLRLTQEENRQLRDQVDQLRQQLDQLEDQIADLEAQAEDLREQNTVLDSARRTQNLELERLSASVDAMQWFWQIDDYYVRNYRSTARRLIQDFESLGLKEALPTENTTGTTRFSPAARYQEICDALKK